MSTGTGCLWKKPCPCLRLATGFSCAAGLAAGKLWWQQVEPCCCALRTHCSHMYMHTCVRHGCLVATPNLARRRSRSFGAYAPISQAAESSAPQPV